MRMLIVALFLVLVSPASPAAALYDETAPEVFVELKVNRDLLRQARAQGLDLNALLQSQLVNTLQRGQAGTQDTHQALLERAFENLNAVAFAPLQLDASSTAQQTQALCRSVSADIDRLVTQAEARAALPPPRDMQEVASLNRERERLFQAFNARQKAESARLKVSGPVLQKSCPQLKQKQAAAGTAIKTVLAPYSPERWCQTMMRKPQSAWSMADANQFVKLCTGVKAN